MDWERFYATHSLAIDRTDYLTQVGHTESGRPIDAEQFSWIVSRIRELLDLGPSDILLDLCCGNGLITKELASTAREVVGVDFSKPLLEIANQDHRSGNVSYHHLNVLELQGLSSRDSRKFNKIVMYAALQHFRKKDLSSILKNILRLSTSERVILLGFVPDLKRKWSLYDSPKRKLAHIVRWVSRKERMGTWWDQEYISTVCEELGLRCGFHELDPKLHASRYRFDVRIA
jgi:cyclopropane fatty-acyl-phospholipid synthase-like methyltransferase